MTRLLLQLAENCGNPEQWASRLSSMIICGVLAGIMSVALRREPHAQSQAPFAERPIQISLEHLMLAPSTVTFERDAHRGEPVVSEAEPESDPPIPAPVEPASKARVVPEPMPDSTPKQAPEPESTPVPVAEPPPVVLPVPEASVAVQAHPVPLSEKMHEPAPRKAAQPSETTGRPTVASVASASAANKKADTVQVDTEQGRAMQQTLLAALRAMIERHKRYPVVARRCGYTGTVTAEIRIHDGRIARYAIVSNTGHRSLAQGLQETLRCVQEQFISTVNPVDKTITVPVEYSLR